MKWKDLFDFMEKRVDFRPISEARNEPNKFEDITWNCNGELDFVEEFCEKYNQSFEDIKVRLWDTGGYCDCEVLWNSAEVIDPEEELPVGKGGCK